MGYSGAWVGALVDTWNGSPPPLKPKPMGYGGAWVGGHEFGLAIESLPCHLLARPTPGFKPTPMHAQNPRPTQAPGVVAWAFSANTRPNPSPISHGLSLF